MSEHRPRAADLLAAARREAAPAADPYQGRRNRAGQVLTPGQAEAADGARMGAAVARKAKAEGAAETADLLAAATAGRRSYRYGQDPGRYSAADLATLAQAATAQAAQAAARKRPRAALADGDREALAAEAVALILAGQAEAATGAEAAAAAKAAQAVAYGTDPATARLPRRGSLVALAPDAGGRRLAEARKGQARRWTAEGEAREVSIDGGDLAAVAAMLTALILNDGPQPWRDTARMGREAPVSVEAIAEAQAADDETVSGRDLLALAAEDAAGEGVGQAPALNRIPDDPRGRRRPALAAEARAVLALTALPLRGRKALAAALTADRAEAADWVGRPQPDGLAASSAPAWRMAAMRGRADVLARLADPRTRTRTAQALADLAEAEDGLRDRKAQAAAREADDLARLAPAPDGAAAARMRRAVAPVSRPPQAPAPRGRPGAVLAYLAAVARWAEAEARKGPGRPQAKAARMALALTAPDPLAPAAEAQALAAAEARRPDPRTAPVAPVSATDGDPDRGRRIAALAAARWEAIDGRRRKAAALAAAARAARTHRPTLIGPDPRPLTWGRQDGPLTAADLAAAEARPPAPCEARKAAREAQAREATAARYRATAQAQAEAAQAAEAEAQAIRTYYGLTPEADPREAEATA
jgi:hypothetical protein